MKPVSRREGVRTLALAGLAWLMAAAALAVPAGALAHEGGGDGHDHAPGAECRQYFDPHKPGEVEFISGGRDQDLHDVYLRAAEEIYGKGGVADQLGLALPPHQLEFMPSAQLAQLATLGRHAVPHWYDGAKLINAHRSAGVLEFVTPGCPTCRSFYSDTTGVNEQISVMMHVAGHNNFAARSYMPRVRGADPIAESLELARYMQQLDEKVDGDEVRQWYQYLMTLEHVQDMAYGTFEDPSRFDPKEAYGKDGKRRKHPAAPTASVLQAVIANLPPQAPEWKREMARRFERMNRVYSWYASDKIMNEGHATQMQEILAGHSKVLSSSEHIIDYARLFQGVVGFGTNLGNPYWLGLEAWNCVRRRFNERPEIRNLPPLERDRAYIQYANELISTMTDKEFLRFALDERWVRKHKLLLQRKAEPHEYDYSKPRTKPEDQIQWIVISRDPKRVIDWIVDRVADRRRGIPMINLESFDAGGRNVVSLRHDVFEGVPLKLGSAAQALFVMSRILEKPVSLYTRFLSQAPAPKIPNPWWTPPPPPGELVDARIEVSADGEVKVYKLRTSPVPQKKQPRQWWMPEPITPPVVEREWPPGTLHEELTEQAQEAIHNYRDQSMGMLGPDLTDFEEEHFKPLALKLISETMEPGMPFLSHAPTAASALREYSQLMKERMSKALRLLKAGKLKFRSTKRGIAIRVLPPIPTFELDRRAMQMIEDARPPEPIDGRPEQPGEGEGGGGIVPFMRKAIGFFGQSPVAIQLPELPKPGDKGLPTAEQQDLIASIRHQMEQREERFQPSADLGQGDQDVGDVEWGPDGGGGGEGDGDPDRGMGGESGDPLDVVIPWDDLTDLLDLELPNRKPRTGGEIETTERVREGGTSRHYGEVLWLRMMPTILTKGRMKLERDWKKKYPGKQVPRFDNQRMMAEGMKLLTPQDYVVRDHDTVLQPESKALLILIMDQSGSMHGRPQELIKQFYHTLLGLLRKKYKTIEVKLVGFNESKAIEMTPEQFFGQFLSGADYYKHGWDKGYEIATRKQYKDYDIYTVTAGDFQSPGGPEVHESMDRLVALTNWSGMIQTTLYGDVGFPDLINPVKQKCGTQQWLDWAPLEDSHESQLAILTKFFSKKRPPKDGTP